MPHDRNILLLFNDMVSAMNSVAAIMAHGHLPCAIEFLDHKCLALIGEVLPFLRTSKSFLTQA
jgi:D-lactate dehydrogenase (cytochrome)